MNQGFPRHAEMVQFPVVDGCLQIAGIPLTRLVERVGRTPFYAYERCLITQRIHELRDQLPVGIQLHYAIKANPMPELTCHIAGLVDGLDVASGGELRIALNSGLNARQISFAGPGKTPGELRQAVAAGVLINVESIEEAHLLARIGAELELNAHVAIRINPDFELKSSGMRMGGGAKQFGIDAEQVPDVLQQIGRLGLHFEGFHIYSGSQNLNAKLICEAQRHAFDLAVRLSRHTSAPVRSLNIGGGFGVPYFPGDGRLDLQPIAQTLADLLDRAAEVLPQAQLIVELGRYLIAEAGIYVCRVLDRKLSRGQVFLITDGGLHHHLAASGNFGQVLRKNYPVVIGNRMSGCPIEVASVVGPLCTPLDLLADRIQLAQAHPGDLVVIYQSGAYGATASPSAFLGHPPAIEVLV